MNVRRVRESYKIEVKLENELKRQMERMKRKELLDKGETYVNLENVRIDIPDVALQLVNAAAWNPDLKDTLSTKRGRDAFIQDLIEGMKENNTELDEKMKAIDRSETDEPEEFVDEIRDMADIKGDPQEIVEKNTETEDEQIDIEYVNFCLLFDFRIKSKLQKNTKCTKIQCMEKRKLVFMFQTFILQIVFYLYIFD